MQDYSKLDQLLHKIVLGFPTVSELLFDIERMLFLEKQSSVPLKRPLFVTGLARAGTTVLMRALYESGQFASLTYDDMPFVMAPNLWRTLARRDKKERVKSERAHGDGVEVDFDSPEALEEVFWHTFHGDEYIKKETLHVHTFTQESDVLFAEYQALICRRYDKRRYLSKNNNHILRIRSLARSRTNPLILVPFRDPIVQAHSLLRQHRKFKESSPFVREYMQWLAHYEFGATHRPFDFGKGVEGIRDTESLDYWLQRWIDAYSYLLEFLKEEPANVLPVCYEKLCSTPAYWEEICKIAEIPYATESYFTAPAKQERVPEVSDALAETASSLYRELDRYASVIMGPNAS